MPRGNNQKIKLYRLAQIMAQKTDGDHYLTMPQIMEELAKYEVTADRKTIYVDLADLKIFGLEVEHETIGRWTGYHVVSRNFDLPELKLLVDAVSSSRFITEKKSKELRRVAADYVDDLMRQTEESISAALTTVQNSRGAFRSAGVSAQKNAKEDVPTEE